MRISKFSCLGSLNENQKLFHDPTTCRTPAISCVTNQSSILLFGREYDFNTALDNAGDVVFNYCRKYFLRLNEGSKKRGMHIITTDESSRIHDAITSFFNYIISFLERPGLQITEDFFKKLVNHLKNVRILFHKLSLAKLPNHSLAFYTSSFGTNACSPSFHLVHCHIDFRWQFINILQKLDEVKRNSNIFEVPNEPQALNLCIEDEILFLMNELTWVSIIRFEKTDPTELAHSHAFPCICVKELWFLLMHYPYKKLDFWENFRLTLKTVLEKKSPPSNILPASLQIIVVDYLPCKDRNVFALWFLSDVIQLIAYDANGVFVGKPSKKCENYEVVDDVMRGVLFENEEPSESTLRSLLPLVHRIQTACQHIPGRPITHLWEFFFKKIHSSFYIPGSKLNSGIALSKSGAELLRDVKSRIDAPSFDQRENSFLMFLRILGDHLKVNSSEPSARLFSRIYLKFPAGKTEKFSEFREQGVHHLSSLFLTMAISSREASVVQRLVELLATMPRLDTTREGKHDMIWKSYAASLLALQDLHANMSESVEIILKHVDWCLSEQQTNPLAHFIDGLEVLSQGDVSQTCGILHVIGHWIPKYLDVCRPREVDRLFMVLTPIVHIIESHGGSAEVHAARSKVEQFIIPNLSGGQAGAELAAVCAVNCASSRAKIIADWSNRQDCAEAGRFLAVLLERSSPALAQNLRLETTLQMIWTRCSFAWGATETTKLLSKNFNKFCTDTSFTCVVDEPFISLVNFFATEFAFCQSIAEKSKLRAQLVSFFPKFDQWLTVQFRTVEAINEEVCDGVYRHTGEFIAKCPLLIYSRLDSRCLLKILMDTLILPCPVFRKDYKMPVHVLNAISQNIDKVIEGLLTLDPERDPYVARLVREIVTHYTPRFASISSEVHPFLPVISDSYVTKLVLPYLSSPNIHPDAASILRLLRTVVSNTSPSSISLFNETSAAVLQMLIYLDDAHPFRRICLDYFTIALESSVHRKKIVNLLSEALTKHIKTKSAAWLEVVKKLSAVCRADLTPLLQLARQTIEDFEKSSRRENDPQLRTLINDLEIILG